MIVLGVGVAMALAGAIAMCADYLVGEIFFRRAACSLAGIIAKGIALGGLLFLACGLFYALLCWVFG